MTHQLKKLPRTRATRTVHLVTRRSLAATPTTAIPAARASTTLAMSMMVALRYLEERSSHPPVPATHNTIPIPAPT